VVERREAVTNTTATASSRGRTWFSAIARGAQPIAAGPGTVLAADTTLAGEQVRVLTIVPDPQNRFPRVRHGELGLEEGWALGRHIRDAIAADSSGTKRAILAIVDVQSQAYGRLEALLGIHLSLAAAVDAYAAARMAGHPVIALIVGTALSGGFLAHGAQAHRVLALDDPGVEIHAMRKQSAARVTRRSVDELEELGKTVIPMAYDARQYTKLGLLHQLITGINADAPSPDQVAGVVDRVASAIADIRKQPGDLTSRLNNADARVTRAASIEVRRKMAEQWDQA
jgi:malonate decarboxylase gamma subunit